MEILQKSHFKLEKLQFCLIKTVLQIIIFEKLLSSPQQSKCFWFFEPILENKKGRYCSRNRVAPSETQTVGRQGDRDWSSSFSLKVSCKVFCYELLFVMGKYLFKVCSKTNWHLFKFSNTNRRTMSYLFNVDK